MKKYLLILFSLSQFVLFGQEIKIPKSMICSPVWYTSNENEGSGLFLSDSDFVYFVTARHNLFSLETNRNENKIDTVFNLISHKAQLVYYSLDIIKENPAILNINLDSMNNIGCIEFDRSHDIAIVIVGLLTKNKNVDSSSTMEWVGYTDINKSSSINLASITDINKYSDVNLGNDIILFGFPGSIGLIEKPQFDYSRPLLRKGIIAGKYEKHKSIIIDSPTFFGNSGGPVFEIIETWNSKEFKLIGIVTEYVPYIENWENKSNGAINVQTMNSGYSIVTSIDFAFNLMKKFDIQRIQINESTCNYTYYHTNGKIWSELYFKNGLFWKVISNYNSRGEKVERGTLKDGNGSRYIYNDEGVLLYIETFKNGVQIKRENKSIITK